MILIWFPDFRFHNLRKDGGSGFLHQSRDDLFQRMFRRQDRIDAALGRVGIVEPGQSNPSTGLPVMLQQYRRRTDRKCVGIEKNGIDIRTFRQKAFRRLLAAEPAFGEKISTVPDIERQQMQHFLLKRRPVIFRKRPAQTEETLLIRIDRQLKESNVFISLPVPHFDLVANVYGCLSV